MPAVWFFGEILLFNNIFLKENYIEDIQLGDFNFYS